MKLSTLSQLKTTMRALPLGATPFTATTDENAYFRFYGLNPEDDNPEDDNPDIQHRFGYVDCCDFRIACHHYIHKAAQGSVVILHGYYDHSGLLSHIIRFFLEQKFSVMAFDLPGHGLSSGGPATIEDFSVYRQVLESLLTQCEQTLPKPWLAFGQSTGAAILTDYLNHRVSQNQPMPFKQLILSAPLVRPHCWQLGRIQLYLARLFVRKIPRTFTNNSRNKDFLKFAHSDPLAPGILPTQWVSALDRWIRHIESSKLIIPIRPLIIQGSDDRTVDAKHNLNVLNRLYQSSEVLWLKNARHHLPNELKETRDHYMKWLAEALHRSSL